MSLETKSVRKTKRKIKIKVQHERQTGAVSLETIFVKRRTVDVVFPACPIYIYAHLNDEQWGGRCASKGTPLCLGKTVNIASLTGQGRHVLVGKTGKQIKKIKTGPYDCRVANKSSLS